MKRTIYETFSKRELLFYSFFSKKSALPPRATLRSVPHLAWPVWIYSFLGFQPTFTAAQKAWHCLGYWSSPCWHWCSLWPFNAKTFNFQLTKSDLSPRMFTQTQVQVAPAGFLQVWLRIKWGFQRRSEITYGTLWAGIVSCVWVKLLSCLVKTNRLLRSGLK